MATTPNTPAPRLSTNVNHHHLPPNPTHTDIAATVHAILKQAEDAP